jgi:hypothetical protein
MFYLCQTYAASKYFMLKCFTVPFCEIGWFENEMHACHRKLLHAIPTSAAARRCVIHVGGKTPTYVIDTGILKRDTKCLYVTSTKKKTRSVGDERACASTFFSYKIKRNLSQIDRSTKPLKPGLFHHIGLRLNLDWVTDHDPLGLGV